MSTVLPRAVQTQKLKTLPADLAKIADEMLKAKFGIEEVEEAFGPFSFGAGFAGFNQPFHGNGQLGDELSFSNFEGKEGIRVEFQPWNNNRVAKIIINEPTFPHIMNAVRRFDVEGIRGKKELLVSDAFFNHIMNIDNDWRMRFGQSYNNYGFIGGTIPKVGEIMGIPVIISNQIKDAVLTAII